MIFKEEVPALPLGVVLGEAHLLDTVTGDKIPLNPTAHTLLSLVDEQRSIQEIACTTARYYNVAAEQVTVDFLQLAYQLNENYLLNVNSTLQHQLRRAPLRFRLILSGFLTGHPHLAWPSKRLEISNKSRIACMLTISRELSPRAIVTGFTVFLILWTLLGAMPAFLWIALVSGVALSVSLLVHEAAHAVALFPTPAFLSVHGLKIQVQHPRILPLQGFLVSSAGPVVTGVSGLLVIAISNLLGLEALALAGLALLFNLLGITALAPDGRSALRNLKLNPKPM